MTVTISSGSTSPGPGNAGSDRIQGLDLARALALLGMILVHFHLVVASGIESPQWLANATGALQGRAAAIFVVLAGIGASLGSRRARESGSANLRRQSRRTLQKRGVFLLVAGCAFLTVWEGDILHSYGGWLLFGSGLLFAPTAALVAAMLLVVATGAAFVLSGHFFDHWNLADLTYRGLWTPDGFLRNLFLDGWNPFFPWFALYVFGLILGRFDLRDRALRRRLLWVAALAALAVQIASDLWAPELVLEFRPLHLLETSATPPTPAFIEFGSAVAIIVIVLAIEAHERFPRATSPLVATGQLALTLYIAHVVIGLGLLESIGRLEGQTLAFAVGCGLAFFAASILFSWAWRRRFSRGPLEALMRRLS